MIIATATIVVLVATYYMPTQEKVQTEAGQYSSVDRCNKGAENAQTVIKKAASDAAMVCLELEVPAEHRARVEAYEAAQDAVDRAERMKGKGLVL